MAMTQLAIRFTDEQLETLDALAAQSGTTRTAVVKKLVDDAERARVAALYEAVYSNGGDGARHVDAFGDLDALHRDLESERVAQRGGDTSW
jgi:hypothetical protein